MRQLVLDNEVAIKTEPIIQPEVGYTGDTSKEGLLLLLVPPKSSSRLSQEEELIATQQNQNQNERTPQSSRCSSSSSSSSISSAFTRSRLNLRQAFQAPLLIFELTFLEVEVEGSPNPTGGGDNSTIVIMIREARPHAVSGCRGCLPIA
jgi:hypothetical protein